MVGFEWGLMDIFDIIKFDEFVEEIIKEMIVGEGVDFFFDCIGNFGFIYFVMEFVSVVCYLINNF